MATLINADAREHKALEVRMELGVTTCGRYSYYVHNSCRAHIFAFEQ